MSARQSRELAFSGQDEDSEAVAHQLAIAQELAHGYATKMLPAVSTQESFGDSAKDVLKRARDIVESVIAWAKELFVGKLDGMPEDASDEEVAQAAENVADTVAGAVAPAEIQDVIEEVVMADLLAGGVERIVWIVEPGACELCVNNAEVGPVPIGETFPSGDERAPAHPQCRCHIAPAE